MAKLVIILNKHKLSGKLTKFFTGCYAYHCAWVDESASVMYDMHLIRRARYWPRYADSEIVYFDVPEVTSEFLLRKLLSDDSTYGVLDYSLFALRKLYHIFGKSTRNVKGKICSEMINEDLIDSGVITPWAKEDGPPSPCDLLCWFSKNKNG